MKYLFISLYFIFVLLLVIHYIPNIPIQAQSESIKTSTRYISGHSYILFTNNDSISVVHDEACFSRSHGK